MRRMNVFFSPKLILQKARDLGTLNYPTMKIALDSAAPDAYRAVMYPRASSHAEKEEL